MLKHIKRIIPHRTIRTELMIAILISALLPAGVINLFYFSKMNSFTEDKVRTYNSEIIKQLGQKIEFLLTQIRVAESQLVSTSITSEAFREYEQKTPLEKVHIYNDTLNKLNDIRRAYSNMFHIYLVGTDGQVYSTNQVFAKGKLLDSDWIKSLNAMPYGEIILPTHEAAYFNINNENDRPKVVSFIKKITRFAENNAIGIIQIDLDYSEIESIMKDVNIGADSGLWLVDANGKAIYSSRTPDAGSAEGNILLPGVSDDLEYSNASRDRVLVDYVFKKADWKVVASISNHSSLIQLQELNTLYLLIIFMSVLFSLLLSYVISVGLTKPIAKLVKSMKKVGDGEFGTIALKTKNKDLLILSNSFNLMVNRIDNLMKNIVDKERDNINVHLKALQAQINPHFLYNTLEVVRSIALDHEIGSIAEISKSLAKMFRYSINKDKEIVTLEEELEHIRCYLRIQKYRFGNKFEVIFNIQKDMLELRIIKFILQPLVENAIYHGIESKMGSGKIVIFGSRSHDLMYLQVSDNGLGMAQEKAAEITHALMTNALELSNTDGQPGIGIGILNVNSRIKLFYGEEYGLSIKSVENEGTTVYITIPLKG